MDTLCCAASKQLEPLDEGSKLDASCAVHWRNHNTKFVRLGSLDIGGGYQPIVHGDCTCNQVLSLRNRVLGNTVKPSSEGVALLRRGLVRLKQGLPVVSPGDIFDLPLRHSGSKGRRYHDAAVDFCNFGSTKFDARVTMFVKSERFNPHAKVNPDPRAVQFRSPRYCVQLAQYLRPCEEVLYQIDSVSDGVCRSRNVAKGMNSVERAETLVYKCRQFQNPVVISLDCTRFDKHVSPPLLGIEHQVYVHMCSDPIFRDLLRLQINNMGRTRSGISYKVRGRRMSGDMNTAIGNVVIMLVMFTTFCHTILKLSRWDCLDDGDDILGIFEEADVQLVLARVEEVFRGFGMVVKVDKVAYELESVEFCQSKLVEFAAGKYKFVRRYQDVMSKGTTGIKNWQSQAYRKRTLAAIGMCELMLGMGVPVLQEYGSALLRIGGCKPDLKYAPDGLRLRYERDYRLLKGVHLRPITQCARESFERAFGLSIVEQLALESRLRSWDLKNIVISDIASEVDLTGWVIDQSTFDSYSQGQYE